MHCLEYGVILDMTRVQMQGVLHCEVIMHWNRIGTVQLLVQIPNLSAAHHSSSRLSYRLPHVLPSPHMASSLDSDITFDIAKDIV